MPGLKGFVTRVASLLDELDEDIMFDELENSCELE